MSNPAGPRGRSHQADAAPNQKAQNFGPSAKRLFGILGQDRNTLIFVIFLAVLSVGLTVLGPWLLGKATNVVFEGFLSKRMPAGASKEDIIAQLQAAGEHNQASMMEDMNLVPGSGIDFEKLAMILGLVIGAYLIGSLLSLFQARMLNRIVQSAMHRLRMEVEEKIHRLPLSYFDSIKRGDLLSRVTNDVDNIGQSLQQTLSQAITSLLTVIGVLVMMFIISPLLALVALVSIPVTIVVTVVVASRSQKLFAEQWKQTGILNARVEETYSGHAVVKVFGHQKDVQEAFEEENQAVYKASFGAQFISGIIMPTMMFVGNLSYVAIAVVGGLQVASGSLSIGGVQSFIQYSRQFTQPLSQLGSMANLLQSGVASAERVFELLDEDEQDSDPAPPNTVAADANRLEFKDVSFGYSEDRPLINNLDLEVRSGSTIAIVGPTGAGKTTLVNLIMRFYDINSGSITLGETAQDAVDIRTMTREDLRSRTGMVLQDTWLFAGTIRDNILYGRPEATEEEMLAASKAAYVNRFVRSLPEGYDTVLDDEAMNLSVGERQLITIARAFLANPRLLILDEATSSVDTRTELLIQRAMSKLRQDRTAFVIAHRLSTIRDANLILMMKDGEIVEQGNHRELMALEGAYWELYNSQFNAPAKEELQADGDH
ncbi:ABC transporter ATP-binding protein [Corynebacterium glutamicum]|uniref:ABC transporter ATP-binding protein n=1 Tax=Corynebacterium TaxID=1716 RepID=UPI00071FF013|nr:MULTISPECIES: ABC transporter ATP-binding protein [Corynebacterium]ALP49701.1 multidrug ABC transporter ATP-binding protein [Corynebacterium glutamicum]ANR62038.1 ABC transporter transmembrane component [[Brevibacterium] flavum ZL-1]ANR65038.1 ABC transporter transmembrane component [Corynebacterium glutamicum ZL-6]ANU33214.1 multidrug ABC transporter ATP-binding protein [Corynebacterium glutamicum]APT06964.1 multidrug ABC transporter ATP-binding protein [Corynebacterium glutamicum]